MNIYFLGPLMCKDSNGDFTHVAGYRFYLYDKDACVDLSVKDTLILFKNNPDMLAEQLRDTDFRNKTEGYIVTAFTHGAIYFDNTQGTFQTNEAVFMHFGFEIVETTGMRIEIILDFNKGKREKLFYSDIRARGYRVSIESGKMAGRAKLADIPCVEYAALEIRGTEALPEPLNRPRVTLVDLKCLYNVHYRDTEAYIVETMDIGDMYAIYDTKYCPFDQMCLHIAVKTFNTRDLVTTDHCFFKKSDIEQRFGEYTLKNLKNYVRLEVLKYCSQKCTNTVKYYAECDLHYLVYRDNEIRYYGTPHDLFSLRHLMESPDLYEEYCIRKNSGFLNCVHVDIEEVTK